MTERGLLFVVSGPSGVGKGTLCKALLERRPNMRLSVSMTTRAARAEEVEGRDYFFTDDEHFDGLIANDELLEYAHVHDKRYGTPRAYVKKMLDEGHDVILEIDVQGGHQVMHKAMEMTGIFILPPNYTVLKQRLMNRKTESEEQIALRIKNAIMEIRAADDYQYLLVNDELEAAVDQLESIVVAQHLRYKEKKAHLYALFNEFEEVMKP